MKEWMAHDPRLDDAKVALTFANPNATGLQHSVQDPGYYKRGTLERGKVGTDALGQYSKKVG